MRQIHIETQVGALSGHDHGITEHGREPAFGSCYPVCVPSKDAFLKNAKRHGLLIKPNETFGFRLKDTRGFKVTVRILKRRQRR
jgi:hypothetical protein